MLVRHTLRFYTFLVPNITQDVLCSFLFALLIPVLLAGYHNYREGNGTMTGTSLHNPLSFHRHLRQL